MASQRVFQVGLRRAGVPMFSRMQPAGRIAQRRFAATQHVEESEGQEILRKQRLQRPVSPHLSIYRPQITWYGSALNRVTGIMLSGSLYLFGIAYLAAPAMGWHLETPSMVAAVAAWPVFAKVGAKVALAFPFFYHSLNGLRHLSWDLGLGFKNTTVMRTGWAVVATSVVAGLYYTFLG
ncbi:mitochondrial succinate dehydrogenase cytochrome b560 subunit C [Westerdykella ornata]|uniref:Mitochondrial succinate dehydrogenase cytochrome b560 subunit C n=1 Tax=Westerdykella ornata TaxID=318751 RepID=A0A6A6J9G9_WESOR|nr:mitochondrial succinate dehydrogenase cytochrome b560 subunit C [Westerdykella ornata]KAF2272628.1 mitochondrial succinate dehydrogenase cytochrome b560 subunit C [Westerdykella ornata]